MHIFRRLLQGFDRSLSCPWGQLILYAIFSIVMLSPFLFHRAFLPDGDAYGYAYPLLGLYTPAKLLSGGIFWNALNFHGFPSFIGDGASLAPLIYLLRAFLGPLDTLHWLMAINITAAGWFFSLLLRRLNLSPSAAFAGGLAFVAGNWPLFPHPPIGSCVPLLPLLLWVALDARQRPLRAAALGWLALSYAWLAVHYNYLPFLLVAYGGATLVMAWRARVRSRAWSGAILPIASCVAALFLSIPVALLRIIPALLVYGPLSFRAGGLSFAEAQSGIGIGSLVQIFFPYAQFPFLSASGAWLFLGALPAALFLLAIPDRRTTARLCLWAYLLLFVIALPFSPLFWVILHLPLFGMLRGQGRWMFLGNAAAAILAGYGFDAFLRDDRARARIWIARLFWLLTVLAILGGIASAMLTFWQKPILASLDVLFDARFFLHTSGLPLEHYHQYIADNLQILIQTLSLLAYRNAISLLAVIVTALLFCDHLWKHGKTLRPGVTALSSLLLTAAVLWPWYPRLPLTQWPPPSNTAAFLQTHSGISMPFMNNFANFELLATPHHPSDEENFLFNNETAGPDANILYGLSSADYYDNLLSRRMGRLVTWAGSDQTTAIRDVQFATLPIPAVQKIAMLADRADILSLLNIRYIVTAWTLPEPFKKVFEESIPPYGIPMRIYENSGARPYAYFADALDVMPVDEKAAFDRLTSKKWPSMKTLLECDHGCPSPVDGKGSVTVTRPSSIHISVQTQNKTPQLLVISENNLLGWMVTVDGKEVTPWIANSVFFGIPLNAGTHHVELRFSYWRMFLSAFDLRASRVGDPL